MSETTDRLPHVDEHTAPDELALAGGHRFSDYALIFRLDELGTRMDVLATRRILGAVQKRAARG